MQLLVRLYRQLGQPDYLHIVQCHVFNGQADAVGELLAALARDSEVRLILFVVCP